jgi:putative transposase
MTRKSYQTDLTDEQRELAESGLLILWEIIEPLIPPPKPGGRPRKTDIREVINAIFYLLRSGCAWRLLPHDFPPWQTVYNYFRQWKKVSDFTSLSSTDRKSETRRDGTWKRIHDALHQECRKEDGRELEPSASIIDSQSVISVNLR